MASDRGITIAIVDNDALLLDLAADAIGRLYPGERLLWVTDDPQEAIDRCCMEQCHHDAASLDRYRPDVLLVDMSMGGVSGPDVCRTIRERTCRTALVGITSYSLNAYSCEALACGAQCLVDKSSLARMMHAAEAVASGDYLDPSWNCARQGSLVVPDMGRRVFFDHAEGIVSCESAEQSHRRLRRRLEAEQIEAGHVEAERTEGNHGQETGRGQDDATMLSPREMQILEEYSRGVKIRAIAHKLELTESSVKTYLSRAREKYHAKTTWELLHRVHLL